MVVLHRFSEQLSIMKDNDNAAMLTVYLVSHWNQQQEIWIWIYRPDPTPAGFPLKTPESYFPHRIHQTGDLFY